jgi:serine/threonine protein kinase
MEYMSNGSLRDLLQRVGRLPVGRSVEIAIAICSALSQVHQKGIIHRDIKPENVLFSDADVPKICDFGVAHLPIGFEETNSDRYLAGHPGTLFYRSPEQVGGERLTGRSDVYAVGVVLYEMLTGSLYLDTSACRTCQDVDQAILHQTPDCPSRRNASVPYDLDSVVMKALAKAPDERHVDAKDLIEALVPFLEAKTRKDSPGDEADRLLKEALRAAKAEKWTQAFWFIGQCFAYRWGHIGAVELLKQAYCPRCRGFVYPRFSLVLQSETIRNGRCPACYTGLVLRK